MQNTHMSARHHELHQALLEIIGAINKPQRDDALMAAAGVRLDRALFPLLIGIERFGPIGVVELADGVGRDYTTISARSPNSRASASSRAGRARLTGG